MIKFFRKIRQRLLTENKFSKYLLYAIGEIVLVVIGILIALQINKSNELKKVEETRQSYYEQLLDDLDKDSINIQSKIIKIEKSMLSYRKYLDKFKTPNLKVDEILDELNKVTVTFSIFRFNMNTFETMKSTGDIKLLPRDIRNMLMNIKQMQEILKDIQLLDDPEYLSSFLKARKLGFSAINFRLENQPELTELLNIKNNSSREIILILDATFKLKNHTENRRSELFREIMADISNLKKEIQLEMK